MMVRDKRTGEAWNYLPEFVPVEPFDPNERNQWESMVGLSARGGPIEQFFQHKTSGQIRYPIMLLYLPGLRKTDYERARDIAKWHMGNRNFIAPDDDNYEFIPEDDDERATLLEYGYPVTERYPRVGE